MKKPSVVVLLTASILTLPIPVLPQEGKIKGMDMPMKPSAKMPPKTALEPAAGASVKIVSPKAGQIFKGDEIPLQYTFVKGKKGAHLHAYVDGELMGMFSDPKKGTITGIRPGSHTLELRVVTEDHTTELNATDKVRFTVK